MGPHRIIIIIINLNIDIYHETKNIYLGYGQSALEQTMMVWNNEFHISYFAMIHISIDITIYIIITLLSMNCCVQVKTVLQ